MPEAMRATRTLTFAGAERLLRDRDLRMQRGQLTICETRTNSNQLQVTIYRAFTNLDHSVDDGWGVVDKLASIREASSRSPHKVAIEMLDRVCSTLSVQPPKKTTTPQLEYYTYEGREYLEKGRVQGTVRVPDRNTGFLNLLEAYRPEGEIAIDFSASTDPRAPGLPVNLLLQLAFRIG